MGVQTLTPRTKVLVASSLLSLLLGSVHAFSVLLEPLENAFEASRSTVSLTYSFALVALTFAVLTGHLVFSRVHSSLLVIGVCLTAAAGTFLAAKATALPQLWFGYSLLFGAANGYGYAFGLQMSAQANPGREGVAMGIVTACYAIGATLAAPLFDWALSLGGYQMALLGLSATLVLAAPVCAGLMAQSGAQFQTEDKVSTGQPTPLRQVGWLWLGYGAGVAAGLMAIGHATGIAKSAGLQQSLWIAPFIIAIFNMTGSLAGGWLADRVRHVFLLSGLSLVSALSLALLALTNSVAVCLIGLGLIGLTYGALIAAYPASVSKLFGVVKGVRIYGKVFTAWGSAGLFAPWFAGFLFDQSGGYSAALLTAAMLGVISAGAIIHLLRREERSGV